MNIKIVLLLSATIIVGNITEAQSVSPQSNKKSPSQKSSLKDAFKNDFLMGAALDEDQINEKDSGAAAL
ncbi:MAG: hypothetical protein ABI861_14225, partial [Panacibacter sp.]